jgi:hypothetical protein
MGGFINDGLLGIYVVLMEAISYSETLARKQNTKWRNNT